MTHRFRTAVAIAIAFTGSIPEPGSAQGVALTAVRAAATHRLLGDPLLGGEVRVEVPVWSTGLRVRLAAERLFGEAERTGSTCVGLGEPCPAEPLRDHARLSSYAVGLGFRMLDWRRVTLDAAVDYRQAHVWVDTRGETSRSVLAAEKALKGSDFAMHASWSPWSRMPLALEAGMTSGMLRRRADGTLIDGYSPFERDIRVRRVRLGISWTPEQ